MRFVSVLTLLILHWAVAAVPVSGEEAHACSPDGLAVGGYDLVSYRQPDGPTPGVERFEVEHDGLRYRFATAANRDRFLAQPRSYLPRYRGWCAATLAMGRLSCPDYTNFKIENGDLLLFELAGFTNGRTLWDSDPLDFRQRADANARDLLP
jgi:hypothetical protein